VQHELALGRSRGEFLEHLADTRRIRAQSGQLLGRLVREEEIEVDGFLDAGEHVARAFAECVELVLGEIGSHAAQPEVARDHGNDERDEQQRECRIAQLRSGRAHRFSPPS
jgi:hypothetical protein